MKILVATSDVPFVEGGHRAIARSLVRALQEAGHSAEILTTPQNRFGRQFSSYLATRLTDVGFTGDGGSVDKLISIRFPSYVLKHHDHVCWLNHRMREYYDLWNEWTGRLSWKGKIKEGVRRRLIQAADSHFLKHNLRKLFAQSNHIREGLIKWGNIPSEVLYPPPVQRQYRTDGYGDFVLSPSRMEPLKRIDLLVHALSKAPAAKAVLAGTGSRFSEIQRLVKEYGLEDRIRITGHVTDEELVSLYATCRAVYLAPVSEDFGLVTLEAFHSGKAIITASDSGGPTELVKDGINGFVAAPDSQQIAQRLQELFESPSLAEQLGSQALKSAQEITWEKTVQRLLQ